MTTLSTRPSLLEPYQRATTPPALAPVAQALAARQAAFDDRQAAVDALAAVDERRDAAVAADVDATARALAAGKPAPKRAAEERWAAERRNAEQIVQARDQLLGEAHDAFLAQLEADGETWQQQAAAASRDAAADVHAAAEALLDAIQQADTATFARVWIARARDGEGKLPSPSSATAGRGGGRATTVMSPAGQPHRAGALTQAVATAYAPSLPAEPDAETGDDEGDGDDVGTG